MKIGDREYRTLKPEDMPKVVLGQLQVMYLGKVHPVGMYPARFLGANFRANHYSAKNQSGWHIQGTNSGSDMLRYGDLDLYIDITPIKRYVIWGHKIQRFIRGDDYVVHSYATRAEAEVAIEGMMSQSGHPRKNYAVVEFNVPEANDA